MIATYEPTKPGMKLNVRERPGQDAAVARKIGAGEYQARSVSKGWVELEGGYADARFLTVTDGGEAKPTAPAVEYIDLDMKQAPAEPDGSDDARATLRKMTNQQLYKLADESGIKVAKGSTKAELIEAIIEGADE